MFIYLLLLTQTYHKLKKDALYSSESSFNIRQCFVWFVHPTTEFSSRPISYGNVYIGLVDQVHTMVILRRTISVLTLLPYSCIIVKIAVVSSMSHRASLGTARGIHLWNCWKVVCMECIILYSSGNKITTTTVNIHYTNQYHINRLSGHCCFDGKGVHLCNMKLWYHKVNSIHWLKLTHVYVTWRGNCRLKVTYHPAGAN